MGAQGFEVNLRLATAKDAIRILEIYEPYISETSITFETETPPLDEFTFRIIETCAIYPYLVAEANGMVIGYAYAHRDRERAAYQWNAELSVYLDGAYSGKGVGRKLYGALLALLETQGIRNALGIITLPNEKSERLHLSLGFTRIGIQQQAGFKDGAWRDVGWFQKRLGASTHNPQPITPIGELDPAIVAEILKAATIAT